MHAKHWCSLRALVALAVMMAGPSSIQGQQFPDYAITNVNVVDVKSGKIHESQTIVLKNGNIASLGSSDSVKIPEKTKSMDGSGKFAIPGLWDMHIHWYHENSMQLFPLNGVTGVRVMWGTPQHHQWRKRFNESRKLGPRMLIASTIVDGPEPFWNGSIVARDAAGGREAVATARKAKSDFVKVYSLLSRDAYFEIAKSCRENKLDFAGHVPMMVTAAEASDAGQRSMEHMYEILIACSSAENELRKLLTTRRSEGESTRKVFMNQELRKEIMTRALATYDSNKAQQLFKKFVKNRTWQCPTLTVLRNIAWLEDDRVQKNPNLKYIPESFVRFIAPQKRNFSSGKDRIKRTRLIYQQNLKILADMQKANVPIIAGTDCLNPFCLPGFSLHTELELMVKAGLKPVEALRTATIDPARYRRAEKTSGSLEPGKVADIVLLSANPLKEITNTKKIDTVFIRGVRLSRKSIDARLAELDRTQKKPEKPAK